MIQYVILHSDMPNQTECEHQTPRESKTPGRKDTYLWLQCLFSQLNAKRASAAGSVMDGDGDGKVVFKCLLLMS